MSHQQVTALRKAGRLEEALALALEALARDPSIWNRRALAWVHYDRLKLAVGGSDTAQALQCLEDIKATKLPADDDMFWQGLPWLLGKLARGLPDDSLRLPSLDDLFDLIRELPVKRPGEAYSFLFKAFLKTGKAWPRFPEFADWWGLSSFSPADYIPDELPNGKRGLALAEQALITLAKHLLREEGGHPPGAPPDQDQIRNSLPLFGQVAEAHPGFAYVLYFRARLLLATGQPAEATQALVPFARRKPGEYWVWDLFADMNTSDAELHFSCLCRALVCKTEPKFSVKLRRRLVPLLLGRGEVGQAAAQVQLLWQVYQKEGWKIPQIVNAWMQSEWFGANRHLAADEEFFRQHAQAANQLLYADLPEEILLVTGLNAPKQVLYYLTASGNQGFFNYASLAVAVKEGELYRVRLEEVKGRTLARSMTSLAVDQAPDTLVKAFSGKFKQVPNQSFGFVEDVFVPPAQVAAQGLTNGSLVSGKALRTWDRQKARLAWRASQVQRQTAYPGKSGINN